jgi:hypothetical protein
MGIVSQGQNSGPGFIQLVQNLFKMIAHFKVVRLGGLRVNSNCHLRMFTMNFHEMPRAITQLKFQFSFSI